MKTALLALLASCCVRGVRCFAAPFPHPSTTPRASAQLASKKEELLRLCRNTENGCRASEEQRAKIEEVAAELAAMNPTRNPAKSPLIEGRWSMIHTTVSGPSNGRLGPFVGKVFQDICPKEKRIANILELGPEWALRGALEAGVEIIASDKWAITFEQVYQKLFGTIIQRKRFGADMARRVWRMTYMDEDLRIVYGGVENGTDEFIFVLERATM